MIPYRLRLWAACALGLLAVMPSRAQYSSDIDIYSGTSSSGPRNVLILLDNTANWNTAFSNEIAALRSTIAALPTGKFNVGLMLFTETGNPNNNVAGGYIRSAIRPLDENYKTKFLALLDSLNSNADKSSGGKAGLTIAEAYYYFSGGSPNSGNGKEKTDYTGNTSTATTAASRAIYALDGNALNSRSGTRYNAPSAADCAQNFIIYISNGAVQDNNSDNTDADNRLDAAYRAAGLQRPSPRIIPLTPNGSQENVADEWARFMKESPSAITTFTLDVDKVSTGQGPGWSALLNSMAVRSGGEYYAVSSSGTELAEKLASTFFKIQSIDSVFSSASLPISTSARGTYLNQVFMGMFRPDANSKPRWRGNLKQYQFKYNVATDTLSLADANNNPAVGTTGFLSPEAVSYWTAPSTFWSQQQMGTPPSGSDSPDGYVVEKGGVAQGIRTANLTSQTERNVLTCVGAGCSATTPFIPFSTANAASLSAVTAANAAERNAIINWVRGTDNAGDESGPGGATTVRPSVHGDVLHSRPAVVNYGNGNIVVFYGTNDGALRAVNGKKTGTGAGQELWSFIPEEHFGKFKRLRDNNPLFRISTTPVIAGDPTPPLLRDYFVDGPISVYQKLNADKTTNKAILYVGMRRGGRFLYALDITNPAQPQFLWRKSNATNDSSGNFGKLGQTWSEARVAKVRGHTNPVIIMGGGYDANAEDQDPPGTTTMGNVVMVLDAFTGQLLKQFNTDRSVPADVTLADSDRDGYTDRAYAVDLGGAIYRIDFEKTSVSGSSTSTSTATTDWGIYKLAALQSYGSGKFFYAPAVTLTETFAAVQVGSGDREKPLKNTGTDAFFTVFDERLDKGTPATAPTPFSTLGKVGTDQNMDNGCYIALATGEKVVNAATNFQGSTYFGTNRPTPPSANSCTANLGEAKVYDAPTFCETPTSEIFRGGGLPPSVVAGVIEVNYDKPDGNGGEQNVTETKPICIGCPNAKSSPIENTDKKKNVSLPRKRRYWFNENMR